METERFCIPEVLFQPQIVGIEQAGISEAVGQAYDRISHMGELGLVASNIILTGGNMNLPQIETRLQNDIRPLVPDIFSIQVSCPVWH
jgi:actin-related protein 6